MEAYILIIILAIAVCRLAYGGYLLTRLGEEHQREINRLTARLRHNEDQIHRLIFAVYVKPGDTVRYRTGFGLPGSQKAKLVRIEDHLYATLEKENGNQFPIAISEIILPDTATAKAHSF